MPSAAEVASLYGVVGIRDEVTGPLGNAEGSLDSFERRFRQAGRNLRSAGLKMMAAVTATILAIGVASVAAAVTFESAFAGVAKTVDATETELAAIEQGLRNMATAGGPVAGLENAHVQLAQIAEAAGQLGVQTEDILDFTETMAMLGMATNLTAEEAAFMAARFGNITGLDLGSEIDNFGAAVVALGNNMATSEGDILSFATRMAASASNAGLAEDEILAFAGTLSSMGLSPELGGTNMAKLIDEIVVAAATGGPALDTFANAAGVTADEFAELVRNDPSQAIRDFVAGLAEMDPSDQIATLDDLGLSSSEARRTILGLANGVDILDGALALASDSWKDATALTEEARRRYETTEALVNRLRNNIFDLGVTIGEQLLPPLNDLLEDLTPLVARLSELSPATIRMIIVAAGLLAVIGPLAAAIGTMVTTVSALGGALMFLAANPVVLLIGALVALGVILATNDEALARFMGTLNTAATAAGQLLGIVGIGLILGFNALKNMFETARIAAVQLFTILGLVGLTVFQAVADMLNNTVLTPLREFRDILTGLWENATESLANLHAWFTETGMPAIKTKLDEVGTSLNGIMIHLAGMWSAVSAGVTTFKDGMVAAFNIVIGIINDVLGKIQDLKTAISGLGAYGGVGENAGIIANSGAGIGQIAGAAMGAIGAEISGRASGGPVMAGQPYVVGEQGAELFVPSRSGTIIPNGVGVGGNVINQTVYGASPYELAMLVKQALRDEGVLE